jgi:hypothetical protein
MLPLIRLMERNHEIDCDVLICGDDLPACETVIDFAIDIHWRGNAGPPLCGGQGADLAADHRQPPAASVLDAGTKF